MKNWSKELSNLTEQFQTHFGGLSKEELNWKPNPAVWSIAQTVSYTHLIFGSHFGRSAIIADEYLLESKNGKFEIIDVNPISQ